MLKLPSLIAVFSKPMGPAVMETSIVPVDESQSPNFISFRAKRKWNGQWDIYCCMYILAEGAEERMAQQEKESGKKLTVLEGSFTLRHPLISDQLYRCVETELQLKGVSLDKVHTFFAEKEAFFFRTEPTSASKPSPAGCIV